MMIETIEFTKKTIFFAPDKIVAMDECIDPSKTVLVPMTRVYTCEGNTFVVLESLDNFLQKYRVAFRSK